MNTTWTRIRRLATREDGFTMIVAIMVLFIASLLVTAAFVSTGGDARLTGNNTNQKKAYYAAMAGISAYKYQLNTNASYWKKCPSIKETAVAEDSEEKYKVKTVPAEHKTESECKEEKQDAILESEGSAVGTFRIESTGIYGTGANRVTRSLVATFTHPGFLDYVYLTNYEIEDPAAQEPEPTNCEHYYAERKTLGLLGEPPNGCGKIEFAPEDKVNGPMHTNDAAAICASSSSEPTFGRSKSDKIEMNGGYYSAGGSCKDTPDFVGTYTTSGPTLTPPETDSELLETADLTFKGRTSIELKKGNPNTISVINKEGVSVGTQDFPANGVIYVENEGSCPIKYTPYNTNYTGEEDCGNVYVKGEYTESLTIAAQNDVIINGPITTTSETAEKKPTGSGTLGLIATNFVRIYHPVKQTYVATSASASQKNSEKETATIKGSLTTTATFKASLTEAATIKESLTTAATISNSGRESPTTTSTSRKEGTGSGGKTCTPASEWEYISSLSGNEKCANTKCSSGTYMSGEGKCAKCNTGYTYLTSEKKCANEKCNTGETYLTGKYECAKCPTGDSYNTSTKECETQNCNANETYLTGEYKCASCPTGDSYIATEKKCQTQNCNTGETYLTGEYKCASCPTGDSYVATEKKCATQNCNTGETYLTGEYKCASCPTGDSYVATEKKCATVLCSSGYTYVGNYLCKGCTGNGETYEPVKEKCEKCSTNDTYAGSAECKYENSASGCDAENVDAAEDPNQWGSHKNKWGWLESPYIDAAILSTHHSFIVDNFDCGKHVGTLNMWGAIAQFWRGPVGSGEHGYTKNYEYDERLKTNQPPDFLTPTSSELKLSRVTAAPASMGEA